MSAEYRFLRFEVVGIASIIILVVAISPLIESTAIDQWILDTDAAMAVVASFFLLSLPLGYVEHQIVVNIYRSPKKSRSVFKLLEDIILDVQESCNSTNNNVFFQYFDDIQKRSFLASILKFCLYTKKSKTHHESAIRLNNLWSHFYARRAVGRYAPIFSLIVYLFLIASGFFYSWPFPMVFKLETIGISVLWWVAIFIFCIKFIDSYAKKIWYEICYLESSIILADKVELCEIIKDIICNLVNNPQYIEKGESYGAALYRL